MKLRSYTILDSDRAQAIADQLGYTRDWSADAAFANSFNATHDPETLFRGYLMEYMAERQSESAFLSGSGYGMFEA